MDRTTILLLSLICFAVITGFTIFILVVALRGKSGKQLPNVDYTDNTVTSPITSRINWTENLRGFTSSMFPPCYDLSSEVKKIFSILKGYNLEKKYMQLLDVYSIVLCQETQVRAKTCPDSFINDRLADLNTLGGDANSQHAITIVKSHTNLQNNKIGKLLVMATDLIEKQMKELQNDATISKSDKEQISGYNSLFYRQRYDLINKRCP